MLSNPGHPQLRDTTDAQQKNNQISAPSISLPKGGGAIRSSGEKFSANPVTGSGSLTLPIFASPGRSGFGPQLALSYDSASGNGPFGLGWSLSVPAITRKTDKGLPRYHDADESDVFISAGTEDLVPFLTENATGQWKPESTPRTANGIQYQVDRYRPRVERGFALIERWTQKTTGETHWRMISRDNVTSIFGEDAQSRISDPADPLRVFSWLVRRSYDDKGNLIVYTYKLEDYAGVNRVTAHERNRDHSAEGPQRYIKHIYYGNIAPYLPDLGAPNVTPLPRLPSIPAAPDVPPEWMFEVVFDYGDDDPRAPVAQPSQSLSPRPDPFSTYRSGFEVRTHRLCKRVLMFHHFLGEANVGLDCLVRSTDFMYQLAGDTSDPAASPFSYLKGVWQTGYKRDASGASGYRFSGTPPVEFEYSHPHIADQISELDPTSLENLPVGTSGLGYQWVDLDGEGVSGVLTEQGGAWFYKANLGAGHFASTRVVVQEPSLAALSAGRQQLMDLAGDGELDLVDFSGPVPGLQEHTIDGNWKRFLPFASLPNIDWNDPNLRFLDLTGDGLADALVTEHEVFTWYASLAEEGFAAAEHTWQAHDEEQGPRLVFGDGTQTVFTADMSGDGLQDLLRIRNGEVCYWPNLGYGRFGAKITMDNAPWFDHPDLYDPRRIRLADVDGSGPTDILYLGRDGARLYVSRSGNALSDPLLLPFPVVTEALAAVQVTDLLGNGTACLVWASALPADARNPVRYLDLMGGQKPHLLIHVKNNLGADTRIDYCSSTKFYLADKQTGRPWITRLAFPVHCVEKITVIDHWRKTVFRTTYSYHHGYFDGIEREFRGFGRVEQVDAQSFGTFQKDNASSPYITKDKTLYQPPVKTITWFHTGAALDRQRILTQFQAEYFPNSLAALPGTRAAALADFIEKPIPEPDLEGQDLSADEWREALRACKGTMLRQEVYELDVTALEPEDAQPPQDIPVRLFSVGTHSCYIRRLQPQQYNRHAVFLVTESEALSYHYELDLRPVTFPDDITNIPPLHPDPRVAHTLNLSFDTYGNVQQSVAIGYGRARPSDDATLVEFLGLIHDVQSERHVSYTETRYTDPGSTIDPAPGDAPISYYRLPQPCEVQTSELTGLDPEAGAFYFELDKLRHWDLSSRYPPTPSSKAVVRKAYHELPKDLTPTMRLVELTRTLFFEDDPTDAATFLKKPLPLGTLGKLGLPYEHYKLALTDDLLNAVFTNPRFLESTPDGNTVQFKLRDVNTSGYVDGTSFFTPPAPTKAANEYWIRSGIAGFEPDAPKHFYLPEKYTDPFNIPIALTYDVRNLFMQSSIDVLGNATRVTRFDYRVLVPAEVQDINTNHTEAYFDVLGRVVAVALKGKVDADRLTEGDNLDDYDDSLANPTSGDIATIFGADQPNPVALRRLLGNATSRYLYHFGETRDAAGNVTWGDRPAGSCAILREQHVAAVKVLSLIDPNTESPLQVAFECSDGHDAVLMKRSQAEPETGGGDLRWIVSGKTILNNKGMPVKQYEPYFSVKASCCAEGDEHAEVGVTPLMYYDAVGRLVRTEMADGTFSRVEFSPWHVRTFDQNDTVLQSQWYADKGSPTFRLPLTVDLSGRITATPEFRAAWLAAQHDDTPTLTVLDSLGRDVIAIAHNRVEDVNGTHVFDGKNYRDDRYLTFTKLDSEGRPLWVRDVRKNLVMQYIAPLKPTRAIDEADQSKIESIPADSVPCYDIAGNLLFQHSMDAGDRWMINDAAGKPMFAWDSRGHVFASSYDALHRPTKVELRKPGHPNWILVGLSQYGERATDDDINNLRGKLYRSFDQSGIVTNLEFDFKGNARRVGRRLASDHDADTDWRTCQNLPFDKEPSTLVMLERFVQITEHDALNRMSRQYNWHRGTGSRVSVYEPSYNERGLLARETLTVGAKKEIVDHSGGVITPAIKTVAYDAKGQRLSITYGNDVTTSYTHDPNTFRLLRLISTRPRPGTQSTLQDLSHTYDPSGNIVEVFDAALPTEYFDNAVIEPRKRYTYDALYRLIDATGREHKGQLNQGTLDNWSDCPYRVDYGANNAKAWRNYTQRFTYDGVGNILVMQHLAWRDTANSWTRQYQYAFDGNRLLATGMGSAPVDHYPSGGPTLDYVYTYNSHGSMESLPHLPTMDWDSMEHLHYVSRAPASRANDPDGCPDSSVEAWYRYDAARQRTRKRVAKQGNLIEERYYFGGLEWYRRMLNGLKDEIETLHLFDGQRRLLMVDQVLQTDRIERGLANIYRYTLSNHLGSSTVEVDENAEIVSYEEYHPYGTTAYQSGSNATEVKSKRYRYTGMERDTETGLSYYGARYYAPWLDRWASCDAVIDSNLYVYVKNNPIRFVDPDGRAECEGQTGCTVGPIDQLLIQVAAQRKFGHWGSADSDVQDRAREYIDSLKDYYKSENYQKALQEAEANPQEGPSRWEEFKAKVAELTGRASDWVSSTRAAKAYSGATESLKESGGAIGADILTQANPAQAGYGSGVPAYQQAAADSQRRALSIGNDLGRGATEAGIFVAEGVVLDKGLGGLAKVGGAALKEAKVVVSPLTKAGEGGSVAITASETAFKQKLSVWKGVERQGEAVARTRGGLVGKIEEHHIFPQAKALRGFFKSRGISIDEYVVAIDREIHKVGQGKGGFFENWNKVWTEWIAQNPNATEQQIFEQAGRMLDEYGLSLGNNLKNYKK